MKQSDRPEQIAAILKSVGSEYSADVATALEAYISSLEANQSILPLADNEVASGVLTKPPMWSHSRVIERENRVRERNSRKQNNYR
jgi:hypothetical protein